MKIITILGARPQFIKAAALSRAFQAYPQIEEVIIHTGQHYDQNMSEIFFEEMDIPKPKYNLGVGGSTHGAMTGQQLEKIETILMQEKPDLVLVYGDTNSTLAGALAATKLHIPIAHVEAGLRSFNKNMPEEINRILTDHISDFLFAPTENSKQNLIKEGIDEEKIFIVGDIMYDVALFYSERAEKPNWFDSLNLSEFALSTIHRAESTDDATKLADIFEGLCASPIAIILPLHPRTQGKVQEFNITIPKNVYVVEPLGYLQMIWLEKNSQFVITDSGGVQKEAYFHKKHCITLREETEWSELVENGYNTLVGTDSKKVALAVSQKYVTSNFKKLYGNGDTAERIMEILNKQ